MKERLRNPYTLGPIKKRDRLAGRSTELKELEYYLRLAQAGQSPHVALIGQRGIGKTSLLLAAAELARAHSLLPVSIDLNESKVQSAGVFWHDLYSALILAAAVAGCWGGVTGKLYSSLLGQLYQRKTIDLELAVLQFPLIVAAHEGDLAALLCPDALIVHDFAAIREELQRNGSQGVALLVDEGDCLGVQRGLLQMLRNVLQRVDGTCFIIAGTDSLFDIVSDVFSPIPRQFHRLDVSRFSEWTETLELVRKPVPEARDVWPSIATVVQLHEVCQGDPTELQLYCHHMYKAVEDGPADRMELTPAVYRAVRGAYRAHIQTVDEKVLDAIDELPDELLFKSRWLRRRRLSLEQNVELERLRHELKDGNALSTEARQDLQREIAAAYRDLYERGISSSSTSLDLIGGAVTAGYWKSLVQTERTPRWTWVDQSFGWLVRAAVAGALSRDLGRGTVRGQVTDGEIDATQALELLRAGNEFKNISRGDLSRWMLACVAARETDTQSLIDVSYLLRHQRAAGFVVSYVDSDAARLVSIGKSWISERSGVLREHGMILSIDGIKEVSAPTDREISRLARVAGVLPPGDMFGRGVMGEAVELFVNDDLKGALQLFEMLLRDLDEPQIRNNLAYCLIAMGREEEALPHLRKNVESPNSLRQHNLAVAEALNGEVESAKADLRTAWEMQQEDPQDDDVVCMLLLSMDGKSARSVKGLPLTAALLINMLSIDAGESSWCEEKLAERFGGQYHRWLEERQNDQF